MHISKKIVASGAGGALVGALIILGIRFVTYKPAQIHYHANFAVYLNGKREQFASPGYYEEIAGSCALGNDIRPAQRVHLHSNMSDLVHVHDHAVTWGALFQNLGWSIGNNFVKTQDKIYQTDSTNHLAYLVNGQAFEDVSNEIIHDKDRLLVDFGTNSQATIDKEMRSVASTAAKADASQDPAACLGNKPVSITDRLKHLF